MTSKHFKNFKYVLYTPYLHVKCLLITARAEKTPENHSILRAKPTSHISTSAHEFNRSMHQ